MIDEYFRHCFHERKKRLGDKARIMPFTGNLFPNTSYHGRQPRGLCVWHPHGPTETEAWRFFLVDADAPSEVKDVLRRFYMRYSGPAGMTDQDDMENWLSATKASSGTIARRYPFNYRQSMGAYRRDDPVPGDVCVRITEQNARNCYRAYARYLNGEGWSSLLGGDDVVREPAEVVVVVHDTAVGAKLRIAGGLDAEVVENMGDGEWLRVRILSGPDAGAEELCHATDVLEVA
jgi:hypothetical protein